MIWNRAYMAGSEMGTMSGTRRHRCDIRIVSECLNLCKLFGWRPRYLVEQSSEWQVTPCAFKFGCCMQTSTQAQ